METQWEDWLKVLGGFGGRKMTEIGFLPFLVLMGISLLCALFISLLYTKFYRTRATGSEIHRAFPLLGISITAVFICIQFSLPLSLGLLGALSIVRFRTPIKEPEEIGFIMLVVATSLCCATFNLLFLAIILIVAVAALVILALGRRLVKGRLNDGMLIVTVPASEDPAKRDEILRLIERTLPKGRLDSISEDRDEAVVSYSFMRLDKEALFAFQHELRAITDTAKSNVFFNRPGEV